MYHLVLAAAVILVIDGLAGSPARAEVKEVRLARQLGLGYLQFYVAQDQKLVEKHGAALGLTASYRPLATPTALTDALLSGSVDIVGIGLTAFLTMWDRTQGNLKVRAIVALNRQPAYLLTRKPDLSSLKEYTASDRIALPAPKVSVQAIMLQMLAEMQLGRHDALDHLTVSMSHPDGTTAMLGGRSEVTSHFTSAPFQYQQLEASKDIRKVLSSYDATEGPNTFTVAATTTTSKWRDANPKVYAAVLAAMEEANQFIASNPGRTAEIFQAIENVKMPVEFIERIIKDPEFSFESAPMNVLKIYNFMQPILKARPENWTDLFFPEAHGLKGS
jgi:NitT/TauT family transport system substrate-binding protein